MKKIAILGHFAFGKNMIDGQTIKTKILLEALSEKSGGENVLCIDTYGGKKALLKVVLKIFSALKKCDELIMLPAQNGVLIFTPILSFLNKFMKKRLHYVVIGGWLGTLLEKHNFTKKLLKKNFHGIYVETSHMKSELEHSGFKNIHILPNYKDIDIVKEEELSDLKTYPIKACTFSRVTEKKGIEDAFKAVCEINKAAQKLIYQLDIYGPVETSYRESFDKMMKAAPEYICYKGEVDYTKTAQTLKKYDLQLFPTRFKTEGIPGSVVEGFFAGTPVIASKWNSFDDVIEEGFTGMGFEFENYADFLRILQKISEDFEKINQMKRNCLNAADEYRRNSVSSISEYFI